MPKAPALSLPRFAGEGTRGAFHDVPATPLKAATCSLSRGTRGRVREGGARSDQLHQLLAEVLALEQAKESLGRALDALRHGFARLQRREFYTRSGRL